MKFKSLKFDTVYKFPDMIKELLPIKTESDDVL